MHGHLAASPTGTGYVGGTLGILAIVVAYWLPTIIALIRHVRGKGQVVVVNLLLGWTVIGWIVALVMAFRAVPRAGEAR